MNELTYFSGDELAAEVWRGKYALDTEKTPDDMHWRMAQEIAEKWFSRELGSSAVPEDIAKEDIQAKAEYIFAMFEYFGQVVPQGSIMATLGTDKIASLSNCFVVGQPRDSYAGIMEKDEQLAQLMKRRGGVGVDISTLRPAGSKVNNSAKTSTGAASFMHRFSNTTREVAQDGRGSIAA